MVVLGLYRRDATDAQNDAILEAVNASGVSFMVSSRLGDRTVLRFAVGAPSTTVEHVDQVWDSLCAATTKVLAPHSRL